MRAPFSDPGLARRAAPFAVGMALALAALPLPPSSVHSDYLVAAVALSAAIAAAVAFVPWQRLPAFCQAGPPLLYLLVVVLLREGEGGAASSYTALVVLPVFWLALYGTKGQLAAAVAGVVGALALPILIVGARDYPDTEWRRVALWVSISGALGFAVQGLVGDARRHAAAAERDLASRRLAERYLRAEGSVTRALAESADVAAAIPRVLEAAGSCFGHVFGAMWRMDPVENTLRCVATWHADPGEAQRYAAVTRELVLTPGSDLPGRAAASGLPVWLADATEDPDFPRARIAREDGLRGAVAIPILSERQLFAVLELITPERLEGNAQLSETLASIGRQMGQFVERKRAERDLMAGAADIAAVLDATRELARSTHADTARTAICEAALKVSGGVLAALFEPDPGGAGLHASAAFGEMPEAVLDAQLPFVGGSSGEVRAFVSAEPVFVPDTSGQSAVSRELKATGVRSCLFQPVVRDGRSIGVLTAAWSRPMAAPPERTSAVLRLLAAEAAVAIERADLLARLEAVARTDDLTGLGNRRAWDEQLPLELARAGRERSPTCVAMLDLDHFKAFNDELGHQAGDRLLKAAAGAWRGQLRATDTLTRYGGEEFAVVLPSCSVDHAVALIERVRGVTPAGQTCSAGVAAWDGDEPAETLVARADAALYAAKNSGRDRVVIAT